MGVVLIKPSRPTTERKSVDEYVREVVDAAPPLTAEQAALIRAVFLPVLRKR